MNMADWTGNKNSVFKTLGASNHTEKERQANDYYATDPIAAELLLQQEEFYNIGSAQVVRTIWPMYSRDTDMM